MSPAPHLGEVPTLAQIEENIKRCETDLQLLTEKLDLLRKLKTSVETIQNLKKVSDNLTQPPKGKV